MNEQTMLWFLQKSTHHELSCQAAVLWMDCYTYLQNQSRACTPQISFAALRELCDLDEEKLRDACGELVQAGMLQPVLQQKQLFVRLVSEPLYCIPTRDAG